MKGKSWPNIMHSKDDGTVTSLNNLTDDITILSNDNANIQVSTEGQAIKIDSSQVSANKADIIATNFNKYLAGLGTNGRTSKNNDCNSAIVNGRWLSEGSDEDPNAPTGLNGILETYRPSTNSAYQRYTPYTSANTSINLFYQRSATDVSTTPKWSEWIKFSTTINGLIVGTLLWNDTTAKAMGSNMMPATGIHYLDPVSISRTICKNRLFQGRKENLFKVGISEDFPYLSMVRTGREVGSEEGDAFKDTCTNLMMRVHM